MRRIDYVLLYLSLMIFLILILIALFLSKKNGEHSESPLIRQTTHGLVEGIELTSSLGQKYYAFRGIPFAEPPITGIDPYTGEKVDRRFKAPVPLKRNWTETLKVHNFRALCQPSESHSPSNIGYSEDCLFLNIYVPAGGAKRKTVIIYIHAAGPDGGVTKDITLAPDFLIVQDNIVVHIEYRVQMFGFLNLGFGEYTGNMGLKDQQLGLKWIYENVENFSGKKDEILIFGASTGGSFVHAHILNSESRKYFNRAFSISGSLDFFKLRKDNSIHELQECLKISSKTVLELIEYFKTANSSNFYECDHRFWPAFVESPNVAGAFLTKTPEEIYNSDKAPILDVLFSIASQESISFSMNVTEWEKPIFEETKEIELPFEGLTEITYPKEFKKATKKFKNAYFSDITNIDAIKRQNIAFESDKVICDNILKSVIYQAHANTNSTDKSLHKNTFLMRSSTHTDLNSVLLEKKINYVGSSHSDDLCYYFYCHYLDEFNVYEKLLKNKDNVYDIIMRRVEMITNFARFGDPSIEGDTPFKSCKSSEQIYCQEISNNPKSHVIMDIKEQLHYNTWREVEDDYKRFMAQNTAKNGIA